MMRADNEIAFPVLAEAQDFLLPELDEIDGIESPVAIESVQVYSSGSTRIIRVILADGVEGFWAEQHYLHLFERILCECVAPFYEGKDARHIARLPREVYLHHTNYKMAGMPFWSCVACVEAAVLDALGRMRRKPVCALLGGRIIPQIPVYLSSMERANTPEEEFGAFESAIARTGAKAIKIKIGGRFSRNMDASPDRTRRLVEMFRERLPGVKLLADANSSYDAEGAIAVGRWLHSKGVSVLEEPCPWEDLDQTKKVADALEIDVSGGEQDTSLEKFDWMIRNDVVDILQPDLMYAGGLIRCLMIARMAEEKGRLVVPHSAFTGPFPLLMTHFYSAVPNIFEFQEYNVRTMIPLPEWVSGWTPEIRDGKITLPKGDGFGLEIDRCIYCKDRRIR